ncbi:glycosyltransferase family 4 protein [Halocatena pleomorpha]|uniref:Glycosyltransferase family 1 protein n=1 Tax=Halocatena pleomorpha TaxID=1785090 RepID=A0A3P3R7R9_9EURY|nr:glycosyltransferase family 4 protein [Halocatena pleomorpha]RRJ29477.1 glycosyltransferase family 1 protein [Halocatena pleomorpha]
MSDKLETQPRSSEQPISFLYLNNTDPESGGGGDLRILEEAKELAKRGHRAHMLVSRTDPECPSQRQIDGVTIQTVKCLPDTMARIPTVYFYLSRMLFPFFSIVPILSLVYRDDFDVLVDNFTPHPSLAAPIAQIFSLSSVAVVHEYHDRTALKKYPLFIGLIQLVVQNLLRMGLYDAVVVPRELTKEQLQQYGVDAPIYVVPNGIDLKPFKRIDAVDESPYELVVVSRLEQRKGIDLLVEAMSILAREKPDIRLAIAGTGTERERLERMVEERGLHDQIDFLGFVSERRKVDLLNGAEIFVLPSRQEGFGISVLEAMAANCAVVVNDLPVLHELVPEEGGVFADAATSEEFADALSTLLETDQTRRRQMGERNRKEAAKYSWKKAAVEAEKGYHKHR